MSWFRRGRAKPTRPVEGRPPCLHRHWTIPGHATVGKGWCVDCEREIALNILFNGLHDRLEEALVRVEMRR